MINWFWPNFCTLLGILEFPGFYRIFTWIWRNFDGFYSELQENPPYMLQQKTVAFSKILEDFIFWWRQWKCDDASNFFLSTFQVKHSVGEIPSIKSFGKNRDNGIYLLYLYRIWSWVIFHTDEVNVHCSAKHRRNHSTSITSVNIIAMLTTSSKITCINVFLIKTGLKAYIKSLTGESIKPHL